MKDKSLWLLIGLTIAIVTLTMVLVDKKEVDDSINFEFVNK